MSKQPPCEHTGLFVRLRTSVKLCNDLDLDELCDRYGGLESADHEAVQTLIALTRELRTIEKVLKSMQLERPTMMETEHV